MKRSILMFSVVFWLNGAAQELDSGWVFRKASEVGVPPEKLSQRATRMEGWMPAVVPGTVLTSLVKLGLQPDPFYGMNNNRIPDIYTVGNAYYTYWFVKDFKKRAHGHVFLEFRGVNYGFDAYVNGHRLTDSTHFGMFLRAEFDITPWLAKDGRNRLAVIVYPPDPPGNPNGGQGGDGTIAKNVTHQYVAGWDWIQPVRDRNTGIWDKVCLRETGSVKIDHPHVVTLVPNHHRAIIRVTAELSNVSDYAQTGVLSYRLGGKTLSIRVTLPSHVMRLVTLPDDTIREPRLWWPNGYGDQPLYRLKVSFGVSDSAVVAFGIRQIDATWNTHTRSRQISVNGRRIFIKGGNWIASDAMLRLSAARYDAEVRYHRDMRLNLIRIWGGALTERPEFYDACDKYGLLVMQDFWNSGDCNGRWKDPKKLEDQDKRRAYPVDHALFIRSVADQVRMIRNHPSLAFWCGGNEITPPPDILHAMEDSLLPALDGTRWFAEYSNTDSMSYNTLGGNGDGPYGLQPLSVFWEKRTFPFNSEVGSVGMGDMTSLKRFLPAEDLVVPGKPLDSVWAYHKYLPYGKAIDAPDLPTFTRWAQLINYDQYRGLIEGFNAHAWDWYTGVIIWKTQNPWTALRGQMYDYYLDPNACFYGLRKAGEKVHVAYNPVEGRYVVFNHTTDTIHTQVRMRAFDMNGTEHILGASLVDVGPDSVLVGLEIKGMVDKVRAGKGTFLLLEIPGYSRNLYWLPDSSGQYSGLKGLAETTPDVHIKRLARGKARVTLTQLTQAPAVFIRLSITDKGERVLPTFYSDNYITIMPGQTETVDIDWPVRPGALQLTLEGFNVPLKSLNMPPVSGK